MREKLKTTDENCCCGELAGQQVTKGQWLGEEKKPVERYARIMREEGNKRDYKLKNCSEEEKMGHAAGKLHTLSLRNKS